MENTLIEISRHPLARSLLQRVGVRPPPRLLRAGQPWSEHLLANKSLVINPRGLYQKNIVESLRGQKARVSISPDLRGGVDIKNQSLDTPAFQASVFDASSFEHIQDLDELYHFFHLFIRKMGFGHKALILIRRWPEGASPEAHASAQAVEGFVRSMAKELGPKGVHLNALRVQDHDLSLNRILPLTHYLLSDYTAFVTGQIFELDLRGKQKAPIDLAGSLAGKRALVTGAARGIGYAIARRLADEGAHILALDRPDAKHELKELCRSVDGEIFDADLSDPAERSQLIDRLQSQSGPIDIIVHNAGITRDRSLFAMEEDQWSAVLNVNLSAAVDLTMQCLQRGLLNKGGRVLCMSSVVGIAGNYGQSNYSAAKAGLIGFVRGLAPHLATQGITANAIAPGFIETAMTADLPFVAKQIGRRFASLAQGGLPEDVAELITFLASPCSQGLNGGVIRVCGGNFLGA